MAGGGGDGGKGKGGGQGGGKKRGAGKAGGQSTLLSVFGKRPKQ